MIPFFVLDRDLSQYARAFKNYTHHEDSPSKLSCMVPGKCPHTILFEKFRRQPIEAHAHDFYHDVMGGEKGKIVHLFEEKTEASQLAEAMRVRYVTGHTYKASAPLQLDPELLGDIREELRGGKVHTNAFRDAFLLGRLKRVAADTYRFETRAEDILERLDMHFEPGRHGRLPKRAAFQLDYLSLNPYFVLKVGDTTTLQFVAPFNETFGYHAFHMKEVLPYPLQAAVCGSRGVDTEYIAPRKSKKSEELFGVMTSDRLRVVCVREHDSDTAQVMQYTDK